MAACSRPQDILLSPFRCFIEQYAEQYATIGAENIPFHHGSFLLHDDVIKWKHFPRNWPFVREIHRSPVNFPHKGQWRGALMFSLIYAWMNDWVNNREAGDLRRQHGHYDVNVMLMWPNDVMCWARPWSPVVQVIHFCHIVIHSNIAWYPKIMSVK